MKESLHSRGALVALFLGLTLVLGAGGWVLYQREARAIQAQEYDELRAIGALKVSQIVGWRNEWLHDAVAHAAQFGLRDLVACQAQAVPKDKLQRELARIREAHGYWDVALLGLDGRILVASVPVEPASERVQGLVEQSLRSQGPVLGDFFRPAPDQVALDVVTPILDPQGRPVALLLLRTDPATRFYPFLQSWPIPSATAETLLVRREGDQVLFLNRLRHQAAPALTFTQSLSGQGLPAAQAVQGRTGLFLGRDYRGVEVLADLQPVPGSPWFLIAKVDTREILAEARFRGGVILAFVGTGVLTCGALLAFLFYFGQARLYQSQMALEKSEARFRYLNENLRDAYVQLDMAGRIQEHNARYREMLGYGEEELGQLTYEDVTPAEWHDLEASIVREEVLPIGYSRVYEKAYRRKDGTVFPVELRTVLLRGEGGEPVGMWALVRDISVRMATEEQLREAQRMAQGTLDALTKHIAILDEEGALLAVNQAWRRFAEANPPCGSPVCEGANYFQVCAAATGPEAPEAAAFAEGIRCVLEGRQREYVQEYSCHSPREQRWFLGRVTCFAGEGPRRIVVAHETITERHLAQLEMQRLLAVGEQSRQALLSLVEDQQRAQEEVRRLNTELEQRVADRTQALTAANKELEAFAYSVSHDLRAPLRHMDGFLSLLARHLGDGLDEAGTHYLNVARTASVRMGQLVDALLAFSRLGRAELNRIPIDTDRLVAAVREDFKEECANRAVRWEVGPLPALLGDPTLVRLVFQNLLGNALKFSRNRPEAVIEIQPLEGPEGERGFVVRDNGAGFDPAYVHKLFLVFSRLHREEEFEGTGIGLANVHRIVTRHGGRVWAEGSPGQGAAFFVTFPWPGRTS